MKIRNRDINIFSMSALDLFASGMGAFILLAVMALPFFGNVSKIPTEAPLQCPEPVICPKPVPCQVCPPPTPPGFQKMEKLDLVVVLDISGSMDKEISGLKAEIRDIAALLDRLSDSAALRIVVFGDDGFDVPVTHFPLTPTKDIAALQAQLQQVNVDVGRGRGSNNTDGEAVFPGFNQAMQTQWRNDATRRTVVIITDDITHPGDDRRLLSAVSAFAATAGNTVSVRYSGSDKAKQNFYANVVTAGNGSYLDKNNGSLTAALLLALLPK